MIVAKYLKRLNDDLALDFFDGFVRSYTIGGVLVDPDKFDIIPKKEYKDKLISEKQKEIEGLRKKIEELEKEIEGLK